MVDYHILTRSLLTRQVVASEDKYSWRPTPTFLNDLFQFLRSKYPEGSLRIYDVDFQLSIDGVGVVPEDGGMMRQDIHVTFKRHANGNYAIHVFGARKAELKGYILEFIKDKIARIKAKKTGKNLRAFTTPGVKEKFNTLPPGISAEIAGFITGNTKDPNVKVEELKTFIARPYEGGKTRKLRARRRRNRKTRKW